MTTSPSFSHTDLATRQSLAHGLLGTALLDIERARRGTVPWQTVHARLIAIGPLIDGQDASLFLGAPAMAYVLHLAAADSDRYAGALNTLDRIVAAHTRQRLDAAHARIDRSRYATFAEYDLFRGLTGLGALLLRRLPHSDEMRGVLSYLVRLTESVAGPDGRPLPGWWVGHAPARGAAEAPGGHANAGLAHGISGPLALLSLAKRHDVTVDGHDAAMARICRWLDQLRRSGDDCGIRWPRWISQEGPDPILPTAPSWCYGTPGIARAQQLAAVALGDEERKRMAERALLHCLSDPHQLDRLTDRGLCHGVGGLLRTVQRVAQDADTPDAFTDLLPQLSERFHAADPPHEPGFLEGAAGAALAILGLEPVPAPATDWDACLLLS